MDSLKLSQWWTFHLGTLSVSFIEFICRKAVFWCQHILFKWQPKWHRVLCMPLDVSATTTQIPFCPTSVARWAIDGDAIFSDVALSTVLLLLLQSPMWVEKWMGNPSRQPTCPKYKTLHQCQSWCRNVQKCLCKKNFIGKNGKENWFLLLSWTLFDCGALLAEYCRYPTAAHPSQYRQLFVLHWFDFHVLEINLFVQLIMWEFNTVL